jgi:hypothetical protein
MLKKRIINIFSVLIMACMVALVPLTPMIVSADSGSYQDVCESIAVTGGDCDSTSAGSTVSNLLKRIINIISAIVGVVAVIMLVVSGFKYITSGGDASKIASAKNTIIYAIVGLIIVALAQVIVHFVIHTTSNTGKTSSSHVVTSRVV